MNLETLKFQAEELICSGLAGDISPIIAEITTHFADQKVAILSDLLLLLLEQQDIEAGKICEILKVLHIAGADIETIKNGQTPLLFAMARGKAAEAIWFLCHSANVFAQDAHTKKTPFMYAVEQDNLLCLMRLFDKVPVSEISRLFDLRDNEGRNIFDYSTLISVSESMKGCLNEKKRQLESITVEQKPVAVAAPVLVFRASPETPKKPPVCEPHAKPEMRTLRL
jgi:hypothetical protein